MPKLVNKFQRHRLFEINPHGNDYFVGDIHGEYDLLMQTLDCISFDCQADRLFAVGDLIDRGPANIQVVNLLNQPWFFSVLGNHEQLFINGFEDNTYRYLHQGNGGDWTLDYPKEVLEMLRDTLLHHGAATFTVQSKNGDIGIVHSSVEETWQNTIDSDNHDLLLWNRKRFKKAASNGEVLPVTDIDLIVSGHSRTENPLVGANHIWIDTHKATGELTVLSAKELFSLLD